MAYTALLVRENSEHRQNLIDWQGPAGSAPLFEPRTPALDAQQAQHMSGERREDTSEERTGAQWQQQMLSAPWPASAALAQSRLRAPSGQDGAPAAERGRLPRPSMLPFRPEQSERGMRSGPRTVHRSLVPATLQWSSAALAATDELPHQQQHQGQQQPPLQQQQAPDGIIEGALRYLGRGCTMRELATVVGSKPLSKVSKIREALRVLISEVGQSIRSA